MVTPTARPRSTRAHTPISWLCEAESLRARETGVVDCPAGRDRAADTCGSPGRPGSWASRRSTTPAIGSGLGPGKGFGMPLHSVEGWCCEAFNQAGHLSYQGSTWLKWLDGRWRATYCSPRSTRGLEIREGPARGAQETPRGKSRGVSKAIRSLAFGSSTCRPCRHPEARPAPVCLPSSPPPHTRW